MPPRPATTPFQEDLYATLEPVADQDAALGYPLLTYCGAIAAMFDQIETYARDQDDGTPGWALLFDPDLAPLETLPWLAQFVGAAIDGQMSEADQRATIKSLQAFQRGTPEALKAAIKRRLTGTKSIWITERDGGDAYALRIRTLTTETPDANLVARIINEQYKPAGVILNYGTTAVSYDLVRAAFLTYDAVRTAPIYPTYSNLVTTMPNGT
jgi:hypothetical protein